MLLSLPGLWRLLVCPRQYSVHGPYVASSFLLPPSLAPAWLLYPCVTSWTQPGIWWAVAQWPLWCLYGSRAGGKAWRCQWCWAGGADTSAAPRRSGLCRDIQAQKPKRSRLSPLLPFPNLLGNHLAELDVALDSHYRKCCSKRLWDYKIQFTSSTERSENVISIFSSQGGKAQDWTALNHFEPLKKPELIERVGRWSCLYCRMEIHSCRFYG